MATDLGDLARVLGLDASGTVFDSFGKLPPAAPPDDALAQSPATDAQTGLGQMVRRGLDPSPVSLLRQALSSDGVACGLLAWDVLNGSIVERGTARERLHADARPVRAILPKPRGSYVTIDSTRGAALGGDSPAGPRMASVMRALGGGGIDPTDRSHAALERARNFARILHRSHLSTMASFYLADLFYRLKHAPALPDLVEVLLDVGAPKVEELVNGATSIYTAGEPSLIELATYAKVRTLINAGRSADALDFAEKNRATFAATGLTGDKAATVNPRPTLAYCDAALRKRAATISLDHVEAIARLEMPWRYAFRVMTAYAAMNTPSRDFLVRFITFQQSFGNDYQLWYEVARGMPKGAEWAKMLLAMLVRDVERLSHDVPIWQAAAMILGKGPAGKAALDEIEERLRDQATP